VGKVLLIIFGCVLALILGYIFFGGKKKKKNKENKKSKEPEKEKKIEPAIKSNKPKEEEKKEEPKQEIKEEKPREKIPFKIIRKQSEVKINKKALKAGSRNPSVTKVFDKNGKKIEEQPKGSDNQEDLKDAIDKLSLNTDSIERFGARDPQFNTISSEHEFSIVAPKGSPNRAPIISDRTNFNSHLNVSEDNNLSGIVGTGIGKVLADIDKTANSVDNKTEEMVNKVRKNFLGIEEDIDPFDIFNRRANQNQEVKKKENPLDKIDAKTLIIADAISNPKSRRNSHK